MTVKDDKNASEKKLRLVAPAVTAKAEIKKLVSGIGNGVVDKLGDIWWKRFDLYFFFGD